MRFSIIPWVLVLTVLLAWTSLLPNSRAQAAGAEGGQTLDLSLPPHDSNETDAYLCSALELPANVHSVVHFAPHASQEVVHHMLIYGAPPPLWPVGSKTTLGLLLTSPLLHVHS